MAKVLHSSAPVLGIRSSSERSRIAAESVRAVAPWRSQFWGNSKQLYARQQQRHCLRLRRPVTLLQVCNTAPWLRWWDKDGAPNMVEIHSMQEFIDALSGAGDRLVIVDFYARHCNGCRTLYPKLCKIAREHPEVLFLKINHDENTEICKALNVKVLPLFFVYRAQGHLESFSCTLSKIQRLRDAITKYSNVGDSQTPTVVGNLLSTKQAPAPATSSSEAVATV